ncbi:MAG: xanthine dehydrogenase family protein subunit M [Anaerolineae bacterium]|nr:xanthine dehydrogenase family protein subunit M [Anaerolineae bacterium]
MQPFDYYSPKTFDEAFRLLSQPEKKAIAVAGATDVIPQTRDGVIAPDVVVDIKRLPGLRSLTTEDIEPCCGCSPGSCLYVGAAVTMNELARSELVWSRWPALSDAAASMGNEQVRNRATIGGNICTASPAADSAPALYVLEATVLIKGPQGDRCVPISRFFTGPKRNALRPGEIVTALLIPKLPEGTLSHHEKLSRRKAGDLSIASVAVLAMPGERSYRWRLALGAVGPTPIRSEESEAILATGLDDEAIDRAAASAYGCCCPIGDIRSGLEYRQAMVVNLTRRAIKAVRAQLPTE